MIGFDQTITLYNQRYDSATRQTLWTRTIIKGASWAGGQKVSVGEGLQSNDGYSVRIPTRSMPGGFVMRDEYLKLSDPKDYWTVQNGDVVVLGVAPDAVGGITEITQRFTDCFTITALRTDSLTRLLPHLRLEGK